MDNQNAYIRSKLLARFSEREAMQMADWIQQEVGKKYANKNKKEQEEQIQLIITKLMTGEPFDYVLGNSVFYGREFIVNKHVLIPRPETEELTQICIQYLKSFDSMVNVLDIGTGSGCIAITIALENPYAHVTAIDVSIEALIVAEDNARKLGAQVHFEQHDVLDARIDSNLKQYHLIVSNPPYIAKNEIDQMSRSTVDHEPQIALFADDEDPLIFYRRIADLASKHLVADGYLCFELNEFRTAEVQQILSNSGYADIELIPDIQGKPRMIKANWPGSR